LALLRKLAERKIEVQELGVVIASKDTTITYQRDVNAALEKNARKNEKRKWWSGFTWGSLGLLALEVILGLILLGA